MNTDQTNTDQPDKEPLFHAPFAQPSQQSTNIVTSTPNEPGEKQPAPKNRLMLIIGVLAVLELLVIITLAIAVASKSNSTSNTPKTSSDNSQAQGPTAATSSSVQLTDDSITQDLSSLNDDKDFPADKFSDQSLNL